MMITFKPLSALFDTLPPNEVKKIQEEARQISTAMRLAELRKEQQLTQGDVAAKMGTSQANVSKIEQRSNVQIDTLAEYAHALGARLNIEFIMPDGSHQTITSY